MLTDADGTIFTRSDKVEQWVGQKLDMPASPIGADGAVRAANEAGADSVIAVAASLLAVLTLTTHLAAYWIARYISTPILDLANTTLGVTAGQSGRRATESGPREIAELARKFNTMMDEHERYVASQEALAERDRRIEDLIQNRTVLVREVHHRIKNHLPGLLGLIEDCQRRRPEVASDLETLQGQILSLAVVHGLQARQVSEDLQLGELLRQQVDLLQHSHEGLDVVIEEDSAVGERVISNGDAVPIALVITELLINARKHGTGRINVRLFRAEGAVWIGIGNPVIGCGGVDVATGEGFGTGLGLVKAMLVNLGEITISCANDHFQADVTLPEQLAEMP